MPRPCETAPSIATTGRRVWRQRFCRSSVGRATVGSDGTASGSPIARASPQNCLGESPRFRVSIAASGIRGCMPSAFPVSPINCTRFQSSRSFKETNCSKVSEAWHRPLARAPIAWPCKAALNAGSLANVVDATLFEKCREPVWVHLRHRRQQEVRVWVMGWREHLFLRALFHNLAILHDHNLVGN